MLHNKYDVECNHRNSRIFQAGNAIYVWRTKLKAAVCAPTERSLEFPEQKAPTALHRRWLPVDHLHLLRLAYVKSRAHVCISHHKYTRTVSCGGDSFSSSVCLCVKNYLPMTESQLSACVYFALSFGKLVCCGMHKHKVIVIFGDSIFGE